VDRARLWIEKNLARYATFGFGLWLVESKETGRPLGRVGLIRQHIDGHDEDEIGYMIHRPYWRQGIAHEAACGVRDYAFNKLGMQRVISLVRPVNIPSQRTALSLGMKPEKLTQHWNLDHIVFSLAR
jgi:[ribosomal protein S5]-alanine N-acetyltransferase